MVDEVTIQVILTLVPLHQLTHHLVPRVPLQEGVSTRDGPLQVIELQTQTISAVIEKLETNLYIFVSLAKLNNFSQNEKVTFRMFVVNLKCILHEYMYAQCSGIAHILSHVLLSLIFELSRNIPSFFFVSFRIQSHFLLKVLSHTVIQLMLTRKF